MAPPTNSQLPAKSSVTVGGFTYVEQATGGPVESEVYNLSAFLASMQAALAASTSFTDFQTRMAALPTTP